jgi:biopolymer transport protein ExbD
VSRKRLQPDLDLTPLIDVLFMLILFFVMTASLLQGQISVRLPAGQGAPIGGRPAVIEILQDGRIRFEGSWVSREETAALALEAGKSGRELILAADRNVPYGSVASILETLRKSGVQDVGLALEGGKTR